MNPYLESPYRWPEVHTTLIVEIARKLNPQLLPRYRAAVDIRVYIDDAFIGTPDTTVYRQPTNTKMRTGTVAVSDKPERVVLPMAYEVTERYLEVREISTQRVITAIELLSPANKRKGEGRKKYIEKRQTILNSATHLVEIDFLRKGDPMPMTGGQKTDYQILVSLSSERPTAERYSFNLRDPIPKFLLPLPPENTEPVVDLNQLLDNVCQETGIHSSIDYSIPPQPALSQEDFEWVKSLSN